MNEFEAIVSQRLPLKPGAVYIAAVSGGADSTAMLAALAGIRESFKTKYHLRCLHVEHGIRPEAESHGDAKAVQALCKSLNVPCKVVHIPQGLIAQTASRFKLGIEGAARHYRHRILKSELKRLGAERILTAHTKDDLLETMLMRFLRGAGPAGLASMPVDRGNVLRPLLGLSRADVVSYLEGKGLIWRHDSTNNDLRYLRNRIRHKLIPCLDEFFPFWRNALEFSGETQRQASEFLSSEAEKRLLWDESGGTSAGLKLPLEAFLREAPIIREEAFFQAVDRLEAKARKNKAPGKAPRRASLRAFIKGLETGASAADLGPVRLEKRAGYLVLKCAERADTSKGFSLLIKQCGSYTLKGRFSFKVEKWEDSSNTGDHAIYAAQFWARLPLVFRSPEGAACQSGQGHGFSDMIKNYKGFDEIIAAEDPGGIAALIGMVNGKSEMLYRREEKPVLYKITMGDNDV